MSQIFVLNNTFSTPWEGSAHGISVNKLTERDFYSIEDFENKPPNIQLLRQRLCLYDDRSLTRQSPETRRSWIIFALGLCASSGIPSIPLSAIRTKDKLRNLNSHEIIIPAKRVQIYRGMSVDFFIKILICVEWAYTQTPDSLEITVDRFNKYLKNSNSPDGLLDLTICLESLVRAEAEISWRFSLIMIKLNKFRGDEAKDYFELFRTLYRFRNSYAHGDPVYKNHYKKLLPQLEKLRNASRKAVACYVAFLKDNKFSSWKDYVERVSIS